LAIDDHEVIGPVTACGVPRTCGRNVSAVPKLLIAGLIDETRRNAARKRRVCTRASWKSPADDQPCEAAHDPLWPVLAL